LEPRCTPSDSLVGLFAVVESLQAPDVGQASWPSDVGQASCLSDETSVVRKTSATSSFVDRYISGGSDAVSQSSVGPVSSPSYSDESPRSAIPDSVGAAVGLPQRGDADSPFDQLDAAFAGLLALRFDDPAPEGPVGTPSSSGLTDAAFGSMASAGTAAVGQDAILPDMTGVSNASYNGSGAPPHGEIRPLRFDPPAAGMEPLGVAGEDGPADARSSGRADTSGGSDLSGGGGTNASSDDGSWDEMFPLDGSGGSGGSGGGELIVDLDIAGIGDDDEESLGGLVVKKYDGNGAPRKEIIIQP